MRIMIDELLHKNNRSRYWLAKETGMTYPALIKIANNQTISIHFDLIEKFCKTLDCSPNDLFEFK
jgi:putative transcriptional regulator